VTLTWVSDLAPAFSTFGGNAEGLPNGDLEFDICNNGAGTARAMEVTPDTTPQAVWQLDVTGQNAYRAFRIPSLYPGVQW
jgi:arylsulfate sulfotransferase